MRVKKFTKKRFWHLPNPTSCCTTPAPSFWAKRRTSSLCNITFWSGQKVLRENRRRSAMASKLARCAHFLGLKNKKPAKGEHFRLCSPSAHPLATTYFKKVSKTFKGIRLGKLRLIRQKFPSAEAATTALPLARQNSILCCFSPKPRGDIKPTREEDAKRTGWKKASLYKAFNILYCTVYILFHFYIVKNNTHIDAMRVIISFFFTSLVIFYLSFKFVLYFFILIFRKSGCPVEYEVFSKSSEYTGRGLSSSMFSSIPAG